MNNISKTILLFVILIASAETPVFPEKVNEKTVISSFAFGSCLHQKRRRPIMKAILKARPQIFTFMGDNIYADTRKLRKMRADYTRQTSRPAYQRLKKQSKILSTWDDHDFGYNDAGRENPIKKGARKLFLEFFRGKKAAARRKEPGIYRSYLFGPPGKRLQVILLDTRYFRSKLESGPVLQNTRMRRGYGPTRNNIKTILGSRQWAWLETELARPADLRILVSSIQVIPSDHAGERWDTMPHERFRLFQLLRKMNAKNLFLISGDRHFAEVSALPGIFKAPLMEFTSSSLNVPTDYARGERNRYRRGRMFMGENFGFVRIDWKKRRARVEIRDVNGEYVMREDVNFP